MKKEDIERINKITAERYADQITKFTSLIPSWDGKHVQFIEDNLEDDKRCDAEISNIKCFDHGVSAIINRISGDHFPAGNNFEIYVSWEAFTFNEQEWYAKYVNWKVRFLEKEENVK